MTFESGAVTGSRQLFVALDGYIQATPGWTVHATLGTYDKVYSSIGTSTTERIFVRMFTDYVDEVGEGKVLRVADSLAGTNGLAFRVYQYFDPSSGDGYSECGLFGPIGFYQRGNSEFYKGDFQLPFTDKIGNSLWTYLQNNTVGTGDNRGGTVFDGKKTVYFSNNTTVYSKIDIVTNTETALTNAPTTFGGRGCYAVNSATGAEGIYYGTDTNTVGFRFMRYNIASNNWTYLSDPGGWRTRYGGSCWNGKDKIYLFRGENQDDWSIYDIPTDTWTPGTTVGTAASLNYINPVFVKANAENGLANDRLYLYGGNNTRTFYAIDLDSNGNPVGDWFSRTDTGTASPFTPGMFNGSSMWYAGGDAIFIQPGTGGTTDQEIRRYSISGDSWVDVNIYALPTSSVDGAHMTYNYHQTYIPCDDEGSLTNFWFFGSSDRVAVVTKDAGGEYDFIYAGLISSYYNRNYATTTAPVSAGARQSVTVDVGANLSSQQYVFVSDMTNATGDVNAHVGMDTKTRLFLANDFTQVESVNGNNVILVNLEHDYPTGTRIGTDLQPVGVTGYRNNRIHMLNHVPAGLWQTNNPGKGMAPQLYRWMCSTSTEATGQSAEEARTGQYMLWPLVVLENDWNHAGDEVRGQFSGVFVVDDSGTATTEDLITFLGNNYLLFKFDSNHYNEGRLLAFGPV